MGSPSYLKVTKIEPEFALYGGIHTIFNKIYQKEIHYKIHIDI